MLTSVIKEDGKIYWFTEDGRAVWGAKTKHGTPDLRSPINGSNRCAFHGGKSPVRIQNGLTTKQFELLKDSFKSWIIKFISNIESNEYVGG